MDKKSYITPSLKALDAADEQLMQQASLPVVTPEPTGGETVDPNDMLSRKHSSVWDEEEE